jgi:hypothetical protein
MQPPLAAPAPACSSNHPLSCTPLHSPACPPARPPPKDFPVTPRDAVPGVARFAPDGRPKRTAAGGLSALAAPLLAPAARAALARARLRVPQQLHRLVAALPGLQGSTHLPP